MLIFVYGTLRKSGARTISALFPTVKFVGEGKVRGQLFDLGSYPGLRLDENSESVIGEVYQIADEMLADLDEIEGCYPDDDDASLYLRREVTVELIDGTKINCWTYECNENNFQLDKLIDSGDWISYVKTRERDKNIIDVTDSEYIS
jgi:gamma-glutamylcyclotransferase (GGCT)/AIG2-like uncharacterized protein YtfP